MACDKSESEFASCKCRMVLDRYAGLFMNLRARCNPADLPTDETMDQLHKDYKEARDHCLICPRGKRLTKSRCSCADIFDRHLSYLSSILLIDDDWTIRELIKDIPFLEMELIYQRGRCLRCRKNQQTPKNYWVWNLKGRVFLIQDGIGHPKEFHYY